MPIEKKIEVNKDVIEEYDKLKKEFADLEIEEKQLKDYLNINVFDYAQNKQRVDDIFSIGNSSMSFLDYDADTHKINPNIPVIEVNNVTKFYASRKVPSLLNVSLKLYLGDIHVVIGGSGSGKTTLFNCMRKVEDYEGEIMVDGKELETHPNYAADELVSFIPCEFSWDLYSTVEDIIFERFQELNLTEIEMQNYIRSSLEQMQLSYARNLHIIDLNLLEKRKLQIIVALVTDPHVLVFDEVFLGLQQHERFDLLEIFNRLKREDRSILLFSHSFNDITGFANTMTILSEGRVYYTGAKEDFFYTKILNYCLSTSDNPKTLEILSEVEGCTYDYKQDIDSIFVNFDGRLNILKFQQECASKGIVIQEMKLLETKLEDLFPTLIHTGNKDAIKSINSFAFFSP